MVLVQWLPDRNCGGRKMERGKWRRHTNLHTKCVRATPQCAHQTATLSIYVAHSQAFLMQICNRSVQIYDMCM